MKKIIPLFRHLFSSKQEKRIQKKEFFPTHSILLAEDNLIIVCAIKNLLERRGYRVTTAEDGSKALSYLKSHTYEWALLDIVLPEIDGIDLVKNYRDWEKEMNKPHLPVFGLTGYPFKSMEHTCKEAGMDFLFEKPFKADDLNVIEDFLS